MMADYTAKRIVRWKYQAEKVKSRGGQDELLGNYWGRDITTDL